MQRNTTFEFLSPIVRFMQSGLFSALLLFFSAILSLVLANTAANTVMHQILNQKIGFTIGIFSLYKPLILWINDGLMSVFFFVVGLELKREIVAGELSNPKNVIMPIVGAVGGMIIPALIFILINRNESNEALNGWGIPMATDIAFALGVLYLLGTKVPIQLKVFLTALAIIDDIGAVSVVAFFYTSDIAVTSLLIGFGVLIFMFVLNKMGVRNVWLYALLGIFGVWLPFLLSGVHATIAAVLVAFTIPSTRKIDKETYINQLTQLKTDFLSAQSVKKEQYLLSSDEENIIGEISQISKNAISPLQQLESSMHGVVLYVVMPIFALANAGVTIDSNWFEMLMSSISIGVILGLLLGKVIGIYGLCSLGLKLKWFQMPKNLNHQMLLGIAFLASIGFTMSLFINSLAFTTIEYQEQAKMAILLASLIAGTIGYFLIKNAMKK